jgi:uncharacterized protein (DUF433 family)
LQTGYGTHRQLAIDILHWRLVDNRLFCVRGKQINKRWFIPASDPGNKQVDIIGAVPSVTQIGSLIEHRDGVHGGRPCVAGTSVSVRRIALWHKAGLVPEEIVQKFGHLSLAQVHAALAYYHANRDQIEADLESEARATESLERTDG